MPAETKPVKFAGPGLIRPRTSFVGRAAVLEEIAKLLAEGAVVTLTGPPGSGKTRLALEAARRKPADFVDEPWWVDLASLRTGELVAGAVATAIGLRGRAGVELVDEIVATIGDSRRFLILDNCEHLLEACACLCETLVTRCRGLVVLATSRISLRIPGENVLEVPPLHIEDEAVQLFADRARSANARFVLGPANEAAVGDICRRLDGIPLAIELAATWAAVMSPSELLPLLDRRFAVLTGGSRGASERQRTLWSAIDWSHELLDPKERILFRRLSVFAGSFTREAAESVCSDEALPGASLLRHLASLCAASMVVADAPPAGVTRYRLLESLRAYGLERLGEAQEQDTLQARHLSYFTDVAEAAFDRRMRGGHQSVIEILAPDRNNIRAALEWGLQRDAERALGLAGTLVEDIRRSLFTFGEMRHRLRELLARTSRDTPRYAWGLIAAGHMALIAVADEEAMRLFTECIRLFQQLGDRRGEAWGHLALGHMKWCIGDLQGASAELRLSEALHTQLGNRFGRHRARLRAAVAEVLDPKRQPAARQELQEAINEGQDLGDAFGAGLAHSCLGLADVTSGANSPARSHFLESIRLLGDDAAVAVAVLGLALCCSDTDPERCLQLIGASDALQPRAGGPKPSVLAKLVEEYRPRATARVGEQAAARAYAAGRAMSREEALALALSPDETPEQGRGPGKRPGGLTQREGEVARLVSDGLTNRQIAESLCLSVRTVETHVDRALTKLGFHSRARLASWVREQGMATKDT
ncbi:MAG: LuxR C-terminal-related transcriptional regulator [Actinomycetota bacterium]|nr:LuxR C-terminal-related transcriptional regulator [Actinomycetota bacterium]